MVATVLTASVSEAQQRRVAGILHDLGLAPGDRIVLSTTGSPTYVSVVLGALRSGIVPVPLDPRLTDHERGPIVDDVAPALVVDSHASLATLLDGPERDLAPAPLARPMHFTSGTTGRPKGVWSGLLTAEHADALVREERALWGLCADDLHLVVSPIYHSAPLRFAMGTLLAGGAVTFLGEFGSSSGRAPGFTPDVFVSAVETLRPTSTFCVPAHLQRLVGWIDEHGLAPNLSTFRLVAHAGAPCPEHVRLRTHELFGPDAVWEFYGSTEGQFTACPAAEWTAHPGTLGRARPGRTVMMDDDGLLWCAVPDWAQFTYWNAPDKTAAAWRDTPDGPAFTVGDLGRVVDGLVYLDSRRDDLIISGGVNVYPVEVERALEGTPGLDDIAVFGREDERWGQQVCAAYVGDVDEKTLRDVAAERLAPPKRPKTYERVDTLPRTASGKVRRAALGGR